MRRLSVAWANPTMLSNEKPYEAAIAVVAVEDLLSALDEMERRQAGRSAQYMSAVRELREALDA